MLINIIMDFTLAPTMKPFTVITSPEPDSMNMIHCCTIRSVLYICLHFMAVPQPHDEPQSPSHRGEPAVMLQSSKNLRWRLQLLLHAPRATQPQQVFPFSHFLSVFTSKSRTEGRWFQYRKKVLEVGTCEEEFGPYPRVSLMHSRIPCLSLSQYWAPALNRIKSEIGRDITK